MTVTKEKGLFPCLHSECSPSVHHASVLFSAQSMYAFQQLKNAVACVGVSHCLCIVLSESVDALNVCLRFGCFLLFGLFLLTPFLLHRLIISKMKGWEGVLEEGIEIWGSHILSFPYTSSLFSFSALHHGAVRSLLYGARGSSFPRIGSIVHSERGS